jgi:hypothetical protein
MSTNRRDFLKRSGGLALTGWVGASGLAAAAEAATTPKPTAAPASRGADSVERWLLETGRHRLDDDVYRAVAAGKV